MYHHLAIKIENCIIKPGVGYGPIHFGMTMDQIMDLLIQKPHLEEKDSDIVWSYFDFSQPFVDWSQPGLRLTFDALEQLKLTSIYISTGLHAIQLDEIELFGIKLSGLDIIALKALLTENGENQLEIKTTNNFTSLISEDLQLTIGLIENTFDSIFLSPYILDNDEYKWTKLTYT